MLAIDTNLIVRYLTGDHPEQSPKARALIDAKNVSVCTTVRIWLSVAAFPYLDK